MSTSAGSFQRSTIMLPSHTIRHWYGVSPFMLGLLSLFIVTFLPFLSLLWGSCKVANDMRSCPMHKCQFQSCPCTCAQRALGTFNSEANSDEVRNLQTAKYWWGNKDVGYNDCQENTSSGIKNPGDGSEESDLELDHPDWFLWLVWTRKSFPPGHLQQIRFCSDQGKHLYIYQVEAGCTFCYHHTHAWQAKHHRCLVNGDQTWPIDRGKQISQKWFRPCLTIFDVLERSYFIIFDPNVTLHAERLFAKELPWLTSLSRWNS